MLAAILYIVAEQTVSSSRRKPVVSRSGDLRHGIGLPGVGVPPVIPGVS